MVVVVEIRPISDALRWGDRATPLAGLAGGGMGTLAQSSANRPVLLVPVALVLVELLVASVVLARLMLMAGHGAGAK
eukprot:5880829-Pyramimonas_sp.AAC.1